jgi:hypothetical protein
MKACGNLVMLSGRFPCLFGPWSQVPGTLNMRLNWHKWRGGKLQFFSTENLPWSPSPVSMESKRDLAHGVPIRNSGHQSGEHLACGSSPHSHQFSSLFIYPMGNLSNNLSSMRQCHTGNHKSKLS